MMCWLVTRGQTDVRSLQESYLTTSAHSVSFSADLEMAALRLIEPALLPLCCQLFKVVELR